MNSKKFISVLVLTLASCTSMKQNSPPQQPQGSSSKPAKDELASENVLQKEPSAITEKYWRLIEVAGKPVTSAALGKEAHFILNVKDSRVSGNGGCNSFGGSYTLMEDKKLTFSKIASTRMACMEPNSEDDFFRALSLTHHYSIAGDTLFLNSAEDVLLAKLLADYSK